MKKKNNLIKKILIIILSIIVLLGISFAIYINNLMNKINFNDFKNEEINENYIEPSLSNEEMEENRILYQDIEQIDPSQIEWNKATKLTTNKDIINVLLLGEEAIGGGRGRTDSIMILTLDVKNKEVKLTSLMRDIYLQIPGKNPNRINTAYSSGGVPLTVQTIEDTFGIDIYGTILVNFESFEEVIDALGGIDLELTKKEANYLNTTNYISKPQYRTMKEGINHMNGNQVLGYSRVRKISGLYGDSDFGRTGRHRAVLKAIFDKYKDQNLNDILNIADKICSYITTDLSKSDILSFISFTMTSDIKEIETLRIPIDSKYKGTTINGMSVLVPDWEYNIKELHKFIYKEESDSIN